MNAALNQHVLVLNRLWQAVNVCTARRALALLFQGHAQVVLDDSDGSFRTFDFDEWRDLSANAPHEESVHAISFRIRVPKIILLFLAIFAPVALSARAGVKSVSQEQIQAARSMGASPRQVIFYVIAPGALPEILVGLRIGMGVGWTTLVAAEMVAADAGLGKMVFNSANFLRTDVVILGTIIIGLVAYAFEMLMRWIERRAAPWKGKI